ncbi:MAG: 3-oxoacyl-ACP synthase III family protein [Byssovorax sp.]
MSSARRGTAAGILGLGACLPETIRTNDFWPPEFTRRDTERQKGDLLAIDRNSDGQPNRMDRIVAEAQARYAGDPFKGAVQRHVITDAEEPSDLEAEAGRRAVADAGVSPEAVDAVLVHSLQPDLLHPSNAPAVQDKCGLRNAVAIAVDNGCCSQVVMMALGRSMIESGSFRHVLCVSSSAASRTVEPMNPAAPIFGDGASALLLGPVPDGYGVVGQFLRTDGAFRDAVVNAVYVDGKPERQWHRHVGPIRLATFAPDRGRETGLRQVEFCLESSTAALVEAGLGLGDVDFFLGPQTIAWLNGALAEAVGVRPERTLDTFAEVANLGSATIAYNLLAARRRGLLRDRDLVLTYSPGAGLTRAAVAFRYWAGAR